MTNTAPYEVLEERAAEQRRQLHDSVSELRSTVQDKVTEFRSTVHDKLDVKKNASQFLGPAAAVAAVLGLLLGYGLTGIFTRD